MEVDPLFYFLLLVHIGEITGGQWRRGSRAISTSTAFVLCLLQAVPFPLHWQIEVNVTL